MIESALVLAYASIIYKSSDKTGEEIAVDHNAWKETVKSQFLAACDTLENAINACPQKLFEDQNRKYQIWYWVSHTIFWLDYYLTADRDGFKPPEPFGLEELDPAGVIPDPAYDQKQLLDYLDYCRKKLVRTFAEMTGQRAAEQFHFTRESLSIAELHLYNLRHVQHHSAQINLILRQEIDSAPGWVFKGKQPV